MKYFALFEIFNIDHATSWHSGSSISCYSSKPFDTYDEAGEYAKKVSDNNWKQPSTNGNKSKYSVHTVVVSCEKEDVEKFTDMIKPIENYKLHYDLVGI